MGLILGDASFWKLKAAGKEQFEKDQQITEAGQKIIPTMSTEPIILKKEKRKLREMHVYTVYYSNNKRKLC